MAKLTQVPLYDTSGHRIGQLTPALARKAMNHGYASPIPHSDPFAVRLTSGVEPQSLEELLPKQAMLPDQTTLTNETTSRKLEVTRVERRHKAAAEAATEFGINNSMSSQFTFHMETTASFFDKVEKGDKGVWAKSIAPRGRQVCIEVQLDNKKRFRIPPILPGDPVCLSKYAPFHALRECQDLLQLAGTQIKLMTTAEAKQYFEKKAALLKKTPTELRGLAEQQEKSFLARKKLDPSAVEDHMAEESSLADDEVISPPVMEIVAEIGGPAVIQLGERRRVDDSHRLPASQALARLYEIQESLTFEDLAYVETRGYWPSVKKWARDQIASYETRHGINATSDDLSDLEALGQDNTDEEFVLNEVDAAPTHKKRGRPRKVVQQVAEQQAVTPKKRGRPRKS